MNKQRRKSIGEVISKLEELREELDGIMSDEQEAFDNLPESLQESDRGNAMQEAIDNLDYAMSSFEEAIEYLESACE